MFSGHQTRVYTSVRHIEISVMCRNRGWRNVVAQARRLCAHNKSGHNKVHTCRLNRKENKTLTCRASFVLTCKR